MLSYIVNGGNKLEGICKVSGSKNASLPIIAASILSGKNTYLYNVPEIDDTKFTLEILKILGCKIEKIKNEIKINSENIKTHEIPDKLMREMRSSVILAGAILGRFKNVVFTYPGGCDIGSRPIDLHLESFKKLGINIEEKAGFIRCSCDKIVPTEIHLDFPSVGATENIILTTVLSPGKTTIINSAMEPEIEDLVNMLNKMGAKVSGAGTNIITIEGVEELKDVEYSIMPDRIEAGTFLCGTAITGGEIWLENVVSDNINPILSKLKECGCYIEIEDSKIHMKAPERLRGAEIKTMPYPGFPTDMQPVFGAMLTTAKGTSVIIETIFENRYKYIDELKRMGAKVTVEGKMAVIKGVKKLSGAEVNSTDLRGGAALVMAGLVANGRTKINNIEHIFRGYENFNKKLENLGAGIIIKEGE